jgi:hypothetical protein
MSKEPCPHLTRALTKIMALPMPPGKNLRERLSVDVGNAGTGLAFWQDSRWEDRRALPTAVLNLYAPKAVEGWQERAEFLCSAFDETLKSRAVVHVYIEEPEFWQGSVKGMTAATKGDLIKLVHLVGMYHGVCLKRGIPVTLIPVSVWKGQLPKPVVISRIKARLPGVKASSHSWDAIGIGLHARGLFTI